MTTGFFLFVEGEDILVVESALLSNRKSYVQTKQKLMVPNVRIGISFSHQFKPMIQALSIKDFPLLLLAMCMSPKIVEAEIGGTYMCHFISLTCSLKMTRRKSLGCCNPFV